MKLFIRVLMVVALVGAISAPAMAEWTFYGSARVAVIYESPDDAFNDDSGGGSVQGDDQLATDVNLQDNSRIGAKVKAGNIKARWEYRWNPNNQRLYGSWNFGSGVLLVGYDYTPIKLDFSNTIYDTECAMHGLGATYGSRRGQIKVIFGGFQIAIIDNQQSTTGLPDNGGTHVYTDGDVIFPKLEAVYNAKSGAFTYQIGAGVQTFSVSNTGTTAAPDIDVTSWIINAGVAYTPGRWYVKVAAYYSVNGGNAGYSGTGNVTANGLTDIYDNKAWGTHIVAGFVINKMFKVEGGYGYTTNEADSSGVGDDPTQFYYIQCPIKLAKNVYIVPEIGVHDLMTTAAGADEGRKIYAGAKTQIDF